MVRVTSGLGHAVRLRRDRVHGQRLQRVVHEHRDRLPELLRHQPPQYAGGMWDIKKKYGQVRVAFAHEGFRAILYGSPVKY